MLIKYQYLLHGCQLFSVEVRDKGLYGLALIVRDDGGQPLPALANSLAHVEDDT